MTLALVFPGQGSQSVGMMDALAAEFPVVRETFAEASRALGQDLWQLVQQGPEEKLSQTEITQPLMLTAGIATWRAWLAAGGSRPQCVAGHSLGEYSALVCSGVLDFSEATRLVTDRARFMQEAVPSGQGGIAAILGLDAAAVNHVCMQAAQGEVLEAVNFNSPVQIVIAGSAAAVTRALDLSKSAGAKRVVPLAMSVPAHSRLMHPAALRLAERLQSVDFRPPQIPVLHNVDARSEPDPAAIRQVLVRQIESPVRWVDIVEKMAADGVRWIVECGPGKVLSGLNKRIAKHLDALPVVDPATLRDALAKTSQG